MALYAKPWHNMDVSAKPVN